MAEKLKTIILRMPATESTVGPAEETAARPQTELIAHTSLRLETQNLEDGERTEVASEQGVLAVGISMPFTLIKPLAGSAVTPSNNWGIKAIGAEILDESAGAGVKVAVLDTGIEDGHEAFDGVHPTIENFTDETSKDIDGHGTHCAGTIFGRDVRGRRIGIARGVTRPLIGKVLGQGGGDSAAIMKAIMWAQGEGANVISMSMGIDFPLFQQRLVASGRTDVEATSIALQAYRENVRLFDRLSAVFTNALSVNAPLLIAASGNESHRPQYTIAKAPPSEADGILSVGAIDIDQKIAYFSNTGVECCAPGVDILSADYADLSGLKALSGTSMATPHVSGAAVLHAERLMQHGPFSAQQLRVEVLAHCVPVPGLSRSDGGRGALRV
ncbi:MAG: S8 family serine peptidase [Gammaproteobacteria bacterium]|nr:S8 family serine peptidase [Gammaproteobacteria bacterium]